MRLPALLLLVGLVLGGCASGVDRERVAAALAAAQHQATHLQAFIAATAPAVETLTAAAADTGNPEAAATAGKILAAYRAAQAALPAAIAAIDQATATLDQVKADAAGKVPWWTVAGGLLLTIAPKVLGLLFPPSLPLAERTADFIWRITATKRQKNNDLHTTKA